MVRFIDLTGQKFGRLTVIERVDSDKRGQARWKCKCECGNETVAKAANLKSGNTKSCGCLYDETISKTRKKAIKNAYEQMKRDELKEGTRVPLLTQRTAKNNTSGAKGVFWDKKSDKWIAVIYLKRERHYLGSFTNKRDAINARKKAEEELFDPILEKYNKKKAD